MFDELRLDPETGYLYWNMEGAKRHGKRAGCLNQYGYRKVGVRGKLYLEHRVVWLKTYGEWPSATIDHINGIYDDNRPANLRLASMLDQSRNRSRQANNTSGVHGVTWHKQCGRWQAAIRIKGRYIHIGLFDDLEEAAKARAAAERELGFHENHGRAKA